MEEYQSEESEASSSRSVRFPVISYEGVAASAVFGGVLTAFAIMVFNGFRMRLGRAELLRLVPAGVVAFGVTALVGWQMSTYQSGASLAVILVFWLAQIGLAVVMLEMSQGAALRAHKDAGKQQLPVGAGLGYGLLVSGFIVLFLAAN